MSNEVTVRAVVDDDVSTGLASAKTKIVAFSKDMGNGIVTHVGNPGKKIVDNIGDSFGKLTDKAGPKLKDFFEKGLPQAALPAIIALAPTLGAAVSAGIIGGAAGGGIIGGLLLVKDDPRVQQAATSLGDEVTKALKVDASPFVGEAISAIGQVIDAFREIRPTLANIFSNSAPMVGPLVDSILTGIKGITRGIDNLVFNAEPVMDAFGSMFEQIGDQVGDTFTLLSQDADEGALALQDITDGITNFIEVSGQFIHILAEIKGGMKQFDDKLDSGQDALEDFFTAMSGGRAEFDITADGMTIAEERAKKLADAEDELTNSTTSVTKSVRDQIETLDGLNEAYLAQIDPAFALIDATDDMRSSQAKYNEAVEEHGRKSPEAQEALRNMAKAAGKMSGAAGDASGALSGSLTPAMKSMLRNAGFSEGALKDLEKQLRGARRAADNWEGTFSQTYITRYKEFGLKSPSAIGGYQGLAHGGIKGAAAGGNQTGLTWVGENGPELASLPAGTTMHTAGDSQRMMRQAYQGSSGPTEVILSAKSGSSRDLMDVLLMALQYECRTNFGGSAQKMIGKKGVAV